MKEKVKMQNNKQQKNIPDGWTQMNLGDLFEFKNGLNKGKEFFGHGTPIVNYTDVYKNISLYAKNVQGLVFVNENEKRNFDVKKGDVFFTRTSETLAEIGLSTVLLEEIPNCVFSGYILRARPKTKKIIPSYCGYSLRIPIVRKDIKRKSSMTTRALTSGRHLSEVDYLFPPLSEQKRIVQVLEAWDMAIEKINKKIVIKKQIKKGLMQDLLTGKKRLRGFSDEWKFTNLSKTCKEIKTGKLDANAMVENGKYRFYTCAKDYYLIDNYAFDTEALLISGNGANVGYIHYYRGKFNAYQRTYVLYNFVENILFIKYLLNLFLKTRIKEEVREGNTPYITMGTLADMSLKIPSLQEQNKIADILITSDKEITKLENKLLILKDQKIFLLNNLIAGVIRTPESIKVRKD